MKSDRTDDDLSPLHVEIRGSSAQSLSSRLSTKHDDPADDKRRHHHRSDRDRDRDRDRADRRGSRDSDDRPASARRRRDDSPDPAPGDRDRDRTHHRDRDRDRDPKRPREDRDSPRDSPRRDLPAADRDRPSRSHRDRDEYRPSHRERDPHPRDDRPRDDRDRDDRDRDYRPSRPRRSPSYDEYPRSGKLPARRPRSPTRSPSPGLSEEQREMRSVFVSQLSARVTDRELGIFFENQAGKVRDARVIVDRVSRRSKGVGYVEFVDLETVQKALALSNTKLLGIPIIVQYTEAEKNRQARDGVPQGPPSGLYVGSLNFALTESDIRQVFQPFGPVELVDLQKDPITGKSKGYAFVKFQEPKDALQAMEKMNNFNLAGREIKVGLVADRTPSAAPFRSQNPEMLDEGAGGNLNNITRIELMQKLSRSDRIVPDVPKAPMFRPNIPQATTRNVMLKDAFDPEEETERDWDIDLRDDVKGEVESKYGKVAEIFVVKESQGEIYIRFETVEAATLAVTGLNGRWFGGRQISCQMTTDSLFDAKKP